MTVWSVINAAYSAVFEVWFGLLMPLAPWLQILITALPVTVLALLVFRYASNQDGIRLAKERIKAYLLELWLYKDDLGVMLRAQGQVMLYSLRYIGLALVPMVVMIVPLGPVIVQLESQFAFRSIQPGESAIFSVRMVADKPVSHLDATLLLPNGVVEETPVLRIDANGQLLWRLRVDVPGEHAVKVIIGDQQITRRLLAGADVRGLWPQAYNAADWRVLGSAAEPSLPAGTAVISTEIDYLRVRAEFLGLSSASWLLLLFTLLLGLMLRGLFSVTF
ncbi:MAG TPA: hypothetical protein QF499_09550 [Gammaproteobacteria bacterium]|jgi:hypothetical protein|nr:hypothetical protein [Gammaproteobacteria bacterium]MDP7661415.1 hypothetical protein [Gammaproteobacteria bacterium]HJP39357.1 hypothetical protein [Gammaproteobacteria bacterium]